MNKRLEADVAAFLDEMLPSPPPPKASLSFSEQRAALAEEYHDRPIPGSVERMARVDNLPKPIREVIHEYGTVSIDGAKLREALRKHPAEKVAAALAEKCRRTRFNNQLNKELEILT